MHISSTSWTCICSDQHYPNPEGPNVSIGTIWRSCAHYHHSSDLRCPDTATSSKVRSRFLASGKRLFAYYLSSSLDKIWSSKRKTSLVQQLLLRSRNDWLCIWLGCFHSQTIVQTHAKATGWMRLMLQCRSVIQTFVWSRYQICKELFGCAGAMNRIVYLFCIWYRFSKDSTPSQTFNFIYLQHYFHKLNHITSD